MKISPETKSKIFALYLGQICTGNNGNTNFEKKLIAVGGIDISPYLKLRVDPKNPVHVWSEYIHLTNWQLKLREASQLTDVELETFVRIFHPKPARIKEIRFHEGLIKFKVKGTYSYHDAYYTCDKTILLQQAQYLYSIGIALPYMEYSIEDLIESGIYLLKEETTQKTV